jgi:hypothetical protein
MTPLARGRQDFPCCSSAGWHNESVGSQHARSWLVIFGVASFALGACAGEEFDGPASSGAAAGQSNGGSSGAGAVGGGSEGGTTGGSGGKGGGSGGGAGSSLGGAAGDSGAGGHAGAGGNAGDSKIVFVTSVPLLGAFAAASDAHTIADEICATEANAAEALKGKQWRAWLSTGFTNAVQVLAATTGPWMRVDEKLVFNSPDEMKKGLKPVNSISRDAKGNPQAVEVWTGTNSNGSSSSTLTCQSWTSATGYGVHGVSTETDTWTNANAGPCSETKHLYCFEI